MEAKKYLVMSPFGGHSNKVFDHKDVVVESQLVSGQLESLISNGFLKPIEEVIEEVIEDKKSKK